MDTAQQVENVRFALELIGDNAALILDSEIERYLGMYPSDWRLAAAALADALAVRAINRPTSFTAVGQMGITWADRANSWMKVAKALREQVLAEDKLAAESGTVSVIQLTRIGIAIEEPEYTRRRRSHRLA